MTPKALLLSTTLGLAALTTVPATAHDDGLTCHEHPVTRATTALFRISHPFAEAGPGGTGKTLTATLLGHALDNHVVRDRDLYDPAAVAATHAAILELEEQIDIVRTLVVRAERMTDPAEIDRAMRLAEDTHEGLPVAGYLDFDAFLAPNRDRDAVDVPFETLTEYLRNAGTPNDLVTAVEDSAAGC